MSISEEIFLNYRKINLRLSLSLKAINEKKEKTRENNVDRDGLISATSDCIIAFCLTYQSINIYDI